MRVEEYGRKYGVTPDRVRKWLKRGIIRGEMQPAHWSGGKLLPKTWNVADEPPPGEALESLQQAPPEGSETDMPDAEGVMTEERPEGGGEKKAPGPPAAMSSPSDEAGPKPSETPEQSPTTFPLWALGLGLLALIALTVLGGKAAETREEPGGYLP